MYPFFNNIYYGGIPPFPVPIRQTQSLKKLYIYELPTTNVSLSDTSVDYGISRCLYDQLPCECYITLQVNQAVPTGGEGLPVTVVTPTGGSNTNSGNTSSSGESKTNVVDHNNNNVVGSDLEETKEVFAFINKREGIIRFVNFKTDAAQVSSGGNTPSPTSYSENKIK